MIKLFFRIFFTIFGFIMLLALTFEGIFTTIDMINASFSPQVAGWLNLIFMVAVIAGGVSCGIVIADKPYRDPLDDLTEAKKKEREKKEDGPLDFE